jgi:hypothetical protein
MVVRAYIQVLDILRFIQSVVWPYLFGKAAEELQQGAAVRASSACCWHPSHDVHQSMTRMLLHPSHVQPLTAN